MLDFPRDSQTPHMLHRVGLLGELEEGMKDLVPKTRHVAAVEAVGYTRASDHQMMCMKTSRRECPHS